MNINYNNQHQPPTEQKNETPLETFSELNKNSYLIRNNNPTLVIPSDNDTDISSFINSSFIPVYSNYSDSMSTTELQQQLAPLQQRRESLQQEKSRSNSESSIQTTIQTNSISHHENSSINSEDNDTLNDDTHSHITIKSILISNSLPPNNTQHTTDEFSSDSPINTTVLNHDNNNIDSNRSNKYSSSHSRSSVSSASSIITEELSDHSIPNEVQMESEKLNVEPNIEPNSEQKQQNNNTNETNNIINNNNNSTINSEIPSHPSIPNSTTDSADNTTTSSSTSNSTIPDTLLDSKLPSSPSLNSFTSRFRGVYWRQKAWCAQIQHGGKKIYLGTHASEIEAAKEYDQAARKYHGSRALTNFDEKGNLITNNLLARSGIRDQHAIHHSLHSSTTPQESTNSNDNNSSSNSLSHPSSSSKPHKNIISRPHRDPIFAEPYIPDPLLLSAASTNASPHVLRSAVRLQRNSIDHTTESNNNNQHHSDYESSISSTRKSNSRKRSKDYTLSNNSNIGFEASMYDNLNYSNRLIEMSSSMKRPKVTSHLENQQLANSRITSVLRNSMANINNDYDESLMHVLDYDNDTNSNTPSTTTNMNHTSTFLPLGTVPPIMNHTSMDLFSSQSNNNNTLLSSSMALDPELPEHTTNNHTTLDDTNLRSTTFFNDSESNAYSNSFSTLLRNHNNANNNGSTSIPMLNKNIISSTSKIILPSNDPTTDTDISPKNNLISNTFFSPPMSPQELTINNHQQTNNNYLFSSNTKSIHEQIAENGYGKPGKSMNNNNNSLSTSSMINITNYLDAQYHHQQRNNNNNSTTTITTPSKLNTSSNNPQSSSQNLTNIIAMALRDNSTNNTQPNSSLATIPSVLSMTSTNSSISTAIPGGIFNTNTQASSNFRLNSTEEIKSVPPPTNEKGSTLFPLPPINVLPRSISDYSTMTINNVNNNNGLDNTDNTSIQSYPNIIASPNSMDTNNLNLSSSNKRNSSDVGIHRSVSQSSVTSTSNHSFVSTPTSYSNTHPASTSPNINMNNKSAKFGLIVREDGVRLRGKMSNEEKERVESLLQSIENGTVIIQKGELAKTLQAAVNPERPVGFYEKLVSRRNLNSILGSLLTPPNNNPTSPMLNSTNTGNSSNNNSTNLTINIPNTTSTTTTTTTSIKTNSPPPNVTSPDFPAWGNPKFYAPGIGHGKYTLGHNDK